MRVCKLHDNVKCTLGCLQYFVKPANELPQLLLQTLASFRIVNSQLEQAVRFVVHQVTADERNVTRMGAYFVLKLHQPMEERQQVMGKFCFQLGNPVLQRNGGQVLSNLHTIREETKDSQLGTESVVTVGGIIILGKDRVSNQAERHGRVDASSTRD